MTSPHILVVTGLEDDPDNPGHYLLDDLEAHVECHDPERKHCKLWIECRTCWDAGRHIRDEDLCADEIVIHDEVHHIYEGMLMTDTGQCISSWDDAAAADEAAEETGNGRWYVDVEWCEGFTVNVGGTPEPAPVDAPDEG